MAVNKAVQKLNVALSHMHKAQVAEAKAKSAEQKALHTEKSTRAAIAKQQKAITDAFEAGTLTPAQQQADLTKLFGLGQQDQKAIDAYNKSMSHDKALVKKDAKLVKTFHKAALKDLHAAELHLSLKQTNKDRKALGLKAVKHAIRPPKKNAATIAEKYLGRYETDLQRHGITKPCPTSESCANFVSSMLEKAGKIKFHTLGVSDLNNRLRGQGWHTVSLKNAKPGDVWICNGAHGESHTEIVASNHNGKVTLVGSNNHPVSSNQQINYDSYSANISGSFILAPPR